MGWSKVRERKGKRDKVDGEVEAVDEWVLGCGGEGWQVMYRGKNTPDYCPRVLPDTVWVVTRQKDRWRCLERQYIEHFDLQSLEITHVTWRFYSPLLFQ